MMNQMKKVISIGLILTLTTGIFVFGAKPVEVRAAIKPKAFSFKVNPETFEIDVTSEGKTERLSEPMEKMKVEGFKESETNASWQYPNAHLAVEVKKESDFLNVQITSTAKAENELVWPLIKGESFVLPLGQGKQFSTADANWKTYLNETEFDVCEGYSMPFFGVNKKAFSAVFILDDMYNTSVLFDTKENLNMQYTHQFTKITKDKSYGYKIAITDGNPVTMAKLYRQDRIEKGLFTTLAEKAKKQKNIEKLYGAPHIYLWDDKPSTAFLEGLKKAGITNAWIGFDSWDKGTNNPEFVKKANEQGYLIGLYDSYHSIHEPGKEQWETAKFEDKTLYETATITKKNGEKATGFNHTGRKLNPVYSIGEVKNRMNNLFKNGMKYNSWFIDCDATGEIQEDYTPGHLTTVEEDIEARLSRMAYIRDRKDLIIGSEGGNDFASQTIAFAHGIELPAFAWRDPDMSKNKKSPYYLGKYYSYRGGVPEVFAKPVPLKPLYQAIFFDPQYDVPLFKLVYNDSVITTYQWGWSTLKIKGMEDYRMMHEVLFNIPPMYHLDERLWKANKKAIQEHQKVWGAFHKKAVQLEMTDFKNLNAEKTVQMTVYGNRLKVIGNFSNQDYVGEGVVVKAHSVKIIE